MRYVLGVLLIAFVIGIMTPDQRRFFGALFVVGIVLALVGVFTGSPYDK